MTAVADTYHALTSDRPYRQALSHDRAMEVIEEEQGRQLCPECVEAFTSLMGDLGNSPLSPGKATSENFSPFRTTDLFNSKSEARNRLG